MDSESRFREVIFIFLSFFLSKQDTNLYAQTQYRIHVIINPVVPIRVLTAYSVSSSIVLV